MMRRAGHMVIILLMLAVVLEAQAPGDNSLLSFLAGVEDRYGSDVDLVNGQKYHYPYGAALGDPFLPPGDLQVSLEIRGRIFEDQRMKYDLYQKQLVLEYDAAGSKGNLVLQTSWVDAFETAQMRFVRLEGPGEEEDFFQEVYRGKVSCYYHWSCLYQLDMSSGSQRYAFSEPRRKSYLFREGDFMEYRSNKSFARVFGEEHQKEIRLYLRQSKLKVNKAHDRQMAAILEHCNALLDEMD